MTLGPHNLRTFRAARLAAALFAAARFAAALFAALLLATCAPAPAPPPAPPPEGTPRLVLFLVIDQGRHDTFERFRPLLTSGLARLLDESVSFTRAFHEHAATNTAPGHATLATGVHPARHGIVDNWWLDRASGEMVAAVGEDLSPARLAASSLGDWLKAAYPPSRVLAAGGKDRGAILTAGRDADAAYWADEDEDGRFVTSDYYRADEPPWLADYHRRLYPDRYFARNWEPLPEVVAHAAEYGLEPLDRGLIEDRFPHRIGGVSPVPDQGFYSRFLHRTPFGDAYLADFARALIEGEELGADAYPDFLGLAFSAMDKIGHNYGPDSPEILDTLLRLDRAIGELLDFVDRRIGLEHTLVSLSSDHGVTPVPEVLAARGLAARRLGAGEVPCFQQAHAALQERFGEGKWFRRGFYLDRRAARGAGIEPAEIEAETRRLIEGCPGVVRVWTGSELGDGDGGGDDPIRRLYANSFHPDRGPDLFVQLEPHVLRPISGATTHGTVYPYDRHVPWLLRLPSGRAATVDEPVATVDVAPTLAALLGLTPPAGLDGVDRGPLLSSDGG